MRLRAEHSRKTLLKEIALERTDIFLFGGGCVCPAPCRERNTVFLMTSNGWKCQRDRHRQEAPPLPPEVVVEKERESERRRKREIKKPEKEQRRRKVKNKNRSWFQEIVHRIRKEEEERERIKREGKGERSLQMRDKRWWKMRWKEMNPRESKLIWSKLHVGADQAKCVFQLLLRNSPRFLRSPS